MNICYQGPLISFIKECPLLQTRLFTLLCETGVMCGESQWVHYEGSVMDGKGTLVAMGVYKWKNYKFTVRNGTLRAFGRQTDMRKFTRMYSGDGKLLGTYTDRYVLSEKGETIDTHEKSIR